MGVSCYYFSNLWFFSNLTGEDLAYSKKSINGGLRGKHLKPMMKYVDVRAVKGKTSQPLADP